MRLFTAVVAAVLVLGVTGGDEEKWDEMKARRLAMVEMQIEARGVDDARVLGVMREVARHHFVPAEAIDQAYEDHPLRIGYEQTISQPYIVALMTALLRLEPDDTVLEIGTGSGYQAAILSRLAKRVYSIEIVAPLGAAAAERLEKLGYDNIDVMIGDGYQGWPEHAPFDAIIVTAAPETVPPRLVEQLADGGRMVVPVGDHYQELVLIEKKGDEIKRRTITGVRFVPMVHPDKTTDSDSK